MEKIIHPLQTALSHLYVCIFLLRTPHHVRIVASLDNLMRTFHDSPSSSETAAQWAALCSRLTWEWSFIRRICAVLISATIGILYLAFYVGDNIVVGVAAVALFPPAIAISHAWCMEWHLRSLEQQPDAMKYWLEATSRGTPAVRRTPVLLAAPLAWLYWSFIAFTPTLVLAVLKLPIPIYIDRPSTALFPKADAIPACNSPGSSDVLIKLSSAPRVLITVILLIGIIHIGFNAFYFAVLAVPRMPCDTAVGVREVYAGTGQDFQHVQVIKQPFEQNSTADVPSVVAFVLPRHYSRSSSGLADARTHRTEPKATLEGVPAAELAPAKELPPKELIRA